MKTKDSLFRERLKQDVPKMPSQMAERFDDTVASFQNAPRRKNSAFRAVRLAGAILVFALFVLPNLNPTFSHAMQEIPVLGKIIRVFSIYKEEDTSGNHYIDVNIPQVEDSERNSQALDYVNADVETLTKKVMDEYYSVAADLPDAHTGLVIDYDVLTNTSQWFTLRLMVYRDAGSSSVKYYFYHIDKQNGTLSQLSDLFRQDFDYQTAISEEILTQMSRRHQENPNMVYWNGESNFSDPFRKIAENQNFYFNTNGDLVIVFEKYEVAPGYMGCPEFIIPLEVYEKGLKSPS